MEDLKNLEHFQHVVKLFCSKSMSDFAVEEYFKKDNERKGGSQRFLRDLAMKNPPNSLFHWIKWLYNILKKKRKLI